jgi:phosphoglycerate dehydrogenase-like enzyme/predicted dehydrogenase
VHRPKVWDSFVDRPIDGKHLFNRLASESWKSPPFYHLGRCAQGITMPIETTDARPLRLLVIGAGMAATSMHMPVLARARDAGQVALALVCDLDRERARDARGKFGFLEETGDAIEALHRQDIDAVYLFASAQLHYAYGIAALEAGKHLFVEKPIAPSYLKAQEMVRTAQARGLVAVGGHNRRFYEALAAVRVRAGKAGWRFAQAVFHKPEYGKAPPFGARTWLSANGIHALDALVFMMGGLPGQLQTLRGEPGAAIQSAFSAVMQWPDGAQGVFLCNNNAGGRQEEYTFHRAGETCTVSDDGLTIEKDGAVERLPRSIIGDGIEAEHAAFLDAIRSGKEAVHSIAAIAPSLFLAELIEDGISGPVLIPSGPAAGVRRNPVPATSILVTRSAELQPALAHFLREHRLVPVEDVLGSTADRPDIVAAILGRGSPPLAADLLARLPGLRIIGVVALSLTNYDPAALLARGVVLVNASSAYADSVAEFALGLAILGRRRAFISHELMRAGGWGTVAPVPGLEGRIRRVAGRLRPAIRAAGLEPQFLKLWRSARPRLGIPLPRATSPSELRGAVVGIIGWGANARVFAGRAAASGARVLVYSEHASASDIRENGHVTASLGEVLAADVVSLHRGLNQSTRHFLGPAELARLRPGAVLINIARGALIQPAALMARLRQGDIFACLDTYEDEPLAATDPLRSMPNVFLTSHIAGGSPDMHAAAVEEVVQKVFAHLSGETVDSISMKRLLTMT